MEEAETAELPKWTVTRRETLAVTRLTPMRDDVVLGCATGFLYRYGQDIALVTNWHVLSGTNPVTRINSGIPNHLQFNINITYPDGRLHIRAEDISLSIAGESIWWQHSYDQIQIDIGVIRLNDIISDMESVKDGVAAFPATMVISENDAGPYATYAYPVVASEVFILGFPLGVNSHGAFPIWKRGSIATEPFIDVGGSPIMYVDALTRRGMSGSPILCFNQRLLTIDGKAAGRDDTNTPWLVGVYAGRDGVTQDEADMALGRAWKRHLLDEIFFDRRPGPAS